MLVDSKYAYESILRDNVLAKIGRSRMCVVCQNYFSFCLYILKCLPEYRSIYLYGHS